DFRIGEILSSYPLTSRRLSEMRASTKQNIERPNRREKLPNSKPCFSGSNPIAFCTAAIRSVVGNQALGAGFDCQIAQLRNRVKLRVELCSVGSGNQTADITDATQANILG